jgi:hypothetical protein
MVALNNNTVDAANGGAVLSYIGNYAFKGCKALQSFNIPNSVTTLGKAVFLECTALTAIDYGEQLTTIPEETFSGCSNLSSVTGISGDITKIDNYAFFGCKALAILRGIEPVGNEPIKSIIDTGSSKITFNDFTSLTTIGNYAFKDC